MTFLQSLFKICNLVCTFRPTLCHHPSSSNTKRTSLSLSLTGFWLKVHVDVHVACLECPWTSFPLIYSILYLPLAIALVHVPNQHTIVMTHCSNLSMIRIYDQFFRIFPLGDPPAWCFQYE